MPTDRIDRGEDPFITATPKWVETDNVDPGIKLGIDPDVLGDEGEGPYILELNTWKTCVDTTPAQNSKVIMNNYYWESLRMNLK